MSNAKAILTLVSVGRFLPIGGSLCFSLLRRRVESKAEEADEGEAETSKAFRAALTLNGVFEQTLPLIVHCVDANIFSSSSSSTEQRSLLDDQGDRGDQGLIPSFFFFPIFICF